MFTLQVDDHVELALVDVSLASTYAELVRDNYDHLSQWLSWTAQGRFEQGMAQFITRSLHSYAEGQSMACAILVEGKVVGSASYNSIDYQLKKVTLGYWLSEAYQHRGIITRVCQTLIDHAFNELGMTKVQAAVATDNRASRAVCERLGMQLEGIITQSEYVHGRLLDHAIYARHKTMIQTD